MKLPSRGFVLVAVIVLLAVGDSFWVTSSMHAGNEGFLIFAGPLLCLLVILFGLIITPHEARRATVTAGLLVGAWPFAVALAGMHVSCDPGMDVFLPEMIILFFPLAALTQPLLLVAVFGLAALIVAAAYYISRRFRHAISILVPAAAAAAVPVVFFAAEGIFRLFGAHSTPGNCVI